MGKVSFVERIKLLSSKYSALLALVLKQKAIMTVGKSKFRVFAATEMGTIQSSLVDFYDDIVMPGIIKTDKPTIVDIGANVGQFAAATKYFFPQCTLYTFEPDAQIFERLKANLAANKYVNFYNLGIGKENGKTTFYKDELSLKSTFKLNRNSHVKEEETIETKTLDSFNITNVDLLKIDVEGFEQEVLQGASKALKNVDYLLVEVSLDRSGDESNLALFQSILEKCAHARIIKFGRPLGTKAQPACQDVIFALQEDRA